MCHGKKTKTSTDFYYHGISLKNTSSWKHLGVMIDHKLNFE